MEEPTVKSRRKGKKGRETCDASVVGEKKKRKGTPIVVICSKTETRAGKKGENRNPKTRDPL